MNDFNAETGAFLRVDLADGCWYGVQPHEQSVIRKAVVDYRERGLDSLVEVEHRDGCTLSVVASTIVSFYLSTPEHRERAVLEEIRQEEWDVEFRK